jgi:adenylate kinase family enzyme
MSTAILDTYIARIEEACGEEKDYIVHLKYDKKDEAITKMLKKTTMQKTIAKIIFDLTYKDVPIRLYATGKAVFKKIKDKNQLNEILTELLS